MTDFKLCGECRFGYWKDGASPSDTVMTCILSEKPMFDSGTCSVPAPVCDPSCIFYVYDRPFHLCTVFHEEEEITHRAPCIHVQDYRIALVRALTTGDYREKGEDDET